MSMLSSWVKRQVKKKGAKAFMLKVLDMIAKATPSKDDDKMVAKIKKVLAKFDDK